MKKVKLIHLWFMLFSLLFGLSAFGKVKVKDIIYKKAVNGRERVLIKIHGKIKSGPKLFVRGKMIQVTMSDAYVWPKIEKKISLQKKYDTTIVAYQFDKKNVRFRAVLPYDVKSVEEQVSLTLKKGVIELSFPQVKATASKVSTDIYDESFLKRLLGNRQDKRDVLAETSKTENDFSEYLNKKDKPSDEVKMSLAGNEKSLLSQSSDFSFATYIGKFVAFLGLVLLLFYAVVTLMKKGVLKKGRLGFLNSTKIVEVLSTTYLGPKRSVLMLKAHNQVFLVGSSEKGLNLISEIDDVTMLIKAGEKKVAGDNFDTSLMGADEKEFKMKDSESESLSEILKKGLPESPPEVSPKKKFSDQIKNKMKNLKSLQ